jgi:hypothetical protein
MTANSLRNLLFVLLCAGLAAIVSAVLWLAFRQPLGMIHGTYTHWIDYKVRLWPLVVILAASFCFAAVAPRAASLLPVPRLLSPRAAIALIVLMGAALTLGVVWVLRAFPNSGDEYAYTFEADTFLNGRFWNAAPPDPDLFRLPQVYAKDGKWVSQYPLGWPALLAIAHLGKLPYWLVSPLLGGVLLVLLALICWRRAGSTGAIIGMLICAPTPFFLFNAGSYFTHIPAAMFGLLFCYHAAVLLDEPRHWRAAVAGIGLGVLGTIRPYDALFFAFPFGVEAVLRARLRTLIMVPAFLLGAMPFLAAYLLQNAAVTGDPLLPITIWGAPNLRVGFHPVDHNGVHQPLINMIHMASARIVELAEWTSPLLVIAYAPALLLQGVRRKLSFTDFVFPCAVIAYLGFPEFDENRYGPRYYFDAFPLLVITVAVAAAAVLEQPRWRAWVDNLICAHVVTSLTALLMFAPIMRQTVDERMDLYDLVRAQNIHNAVVMIRARTGVIRWMSEADLTRNGLDLSGDIVYAGNMPERLGELIAMFPSRRIYAYDRQADSPHGTLVQLR